MKKFTSELEKETQKFYPYLGCLLSDNVDIFNTRMDDVPNSFDGVKSCGSMCLESGFQYFGLECPGNNVRCQCKSICQHLSDCHADYESMDFVDDIRCKEPNADVSSTDCNGPFTSSSGYVEYFQGSAAISSLYSTT